MKKILFAAIAALGFTFANAQVDDHSVIVTKLHLENVIYMQPSIDLMLGSFTDRFDYTDPNGRELQDLWGNGTSPFKVSSNRNFNVTIKAGMSNFIYVGTGTGNNIMPCGVLGFNVSSNGTGGTPTAGWNDLTTTDAPVIIGGEYGYEKPFALKFRAIPGWNYTGGTYMMDVILTATQQ